MEHDISRFFLGRKYTRPIRVIFLFLFRSFDGLSGVGAAMLPFPEVGGVSGVRLMYSY